MSEENLDIRKVVANYLGIVYRAIGYWKWGVAVCLLVTIAGTVYAATRRKIYTSSTRIRVVRTEVRNPGEFVEDDIGEMLRGRLKQFVGSRRFLQEIVDEHDLYRDMKLRKNMTDQEVLDYMRSKMYTGVWQGDEFGFHFMDYDPGTAQSVTKALAQNFMDREKGADYAIYRTKLRRVEKQLTNLEGELDEALARQTRFKEVNAPLIKAMRQRQLGSIPLERDPDIGASSEETHGSRYDSPQLRKLRNRLKTLEDTERRLRNKSTGTNPQVAALQSERSKINNRVNQAKRQYDRLRQQYTEQWPDVRIAKSQLSQLQSQQKSIDARLREAQRSASQPSNELTQIQSQIKSTRDDVRRLARREAMNRQKGIEPAEEEGDSPEVSKIAEAASSSQLKSVEEVESALKRMETEIHPLREQVQELHIQRLKLSFQTKQREQGQFQYVIIDPANRPTKPSGPNRTKIAAASGAGGFALGLGLMVLLGFLDSRIYRPSDMGRLEHIPMLVSIPDFESDIKEIEAVNAATRGAENVVDPPHSNVVDG